MECLTKEKKQIKKTEIFAAYLPQYHQIPENDMFWGEGFTDWVAVKNTKPLFENHEQPRVPLNGNYYDLSDEHAIREQAALAKKYGITGFGMYHYWFKGNKPLLQKPAEIILNNKDIDISFFFSWDNSSWVRSWSNIKGNAWSPQFDDEAVSGPQLLMEHNYGSETEWRAHFDYLLPFFLDERYYKIDGKPIFLLFVSDEPDTICKMVSCWDEWAKQAGLAGVKAIVRVGDYFQKKYMQDGFIYQPSRMWRFEGAVNSVLNRMVFKNSFCKGLTHRIDYEKAWKRINRQCKYYAKKHIFTSGVVAFDDTPRRGSAARIILNDSPDKFEKAFREFYKCNCKYNMEFLLLTAWNEWGEGAYLEPDERYGYGYLEKIRKTVDEC